MANLGGSLPPKVAFRLQSRRRLMTLKNMLLLDNKLEP